MKLTDNQLRQIIRRTINESSRGQPHILSVYNDGYRLQFMFGRRETCHRDDFISTIRILEEAKSQGYYTVCWVDEDTEEEEYENINDVLPKLRLKQSERLAYRDRRR